MDFGDVDGDVVEVLLGRGKTPMTDMLVNYFGIDAVFELVGNE